MNDLAKWRRGQVRGRDGLRGSIRRLHPGIHGFFQGSEESPWQRSSVGRRPKQILCPEGIPSHCAGGETVLSASQDTAAANHQPRSGRGYVLAPRAAAAAALSFRRNSEEEAAKTNSIQQARPPSSLAPAFPGRARFTATFLGEGPGWEFEVLEEKEGEGEEGCTRD